MVEVPVHVGSDREGEQDRADADASAEGGADDEDGELDAGAHHSHRVAPLGDAGHQAVARAGAEPGADVPAAAGPEGVHAEHQQQRRAATWRRGCRATARVTSATRPIRRTLSTVPRPGRSRSGIQQEQHHQPGEDGDGPDRGAGALGHALVQHVPGPESEVGADHQPDAHPEQRQSEEQPGEPRPQLHGRGDGEHPGTLRRRGSCPTCGFGYSRTRIAETSIVEPSSPPSLRSRSTPWVAPVSLVNSISPVKSPSTPSPRPVTNVSPMGSCTPSA